MPWKITKTVQQCAIYVDVRITPKQEPLDVREQLHGLMADAGLQGEVELYVFRPAFEADEKKAAPLRSAITRAHRTVVGGEPKAAPVGTSSMWRDLNCFNEMRIPSLTYGPGVSVGGGDATLPCPPPQPATATAVSSTTVINGYRIELSPCSLTT